MLVLMYMWLHVAKALTREELDEAWSKLEKVAPQQARWLQDFTSTSMAAE
jgi:hypothetical protein